MSTVIAHIISKEDIDKLIYDDDNNLYQDIKLDNDDDSISIDEYDIRKNFGYCVGNDYSYYIVCHSISNNATTTKKNDNIL